MTRSFGVGARAMGMGGAYVGVCDDFTATQFNPAGLAQIRRIEIQTGLSHLFAHHEGAYYGTTKKDMTGYTRINTIGVVFPYPVYRGSLVFAAGYNRAISFDGSATFTGYNPVQVAKVDALELENGGLGPITLASAVDFLKDLSLGFSLDIWMGKDEYSWQVEKHILDSFGNVYIDSTLNDNISTKFTGITLKFGCLYRMGSTLRVGAVISPPITLTAEETWNMSDEVRDVDTTVFSSWSGDYTYKIRRPFSFAAGLSLSFAFLLLTADWSYTDWRQMKYTYPAEFLRKNPGFRNGYRATTRTRIGLEFPVPRTGLRLRGGYGVDPLAYQCHQIKKDRHYFSLGAGITFTGKVAVDLAFVREEWEMATTGYIVEDIRHDKIFFTATFRI